MTAEVSLLRPLPSKVVAPRSSLLAQTSVWMQAQVRTRPTSFLDKNHSLKRLGPANGVGLKIWECFAGLPQQQWFLTDDNRIAVENLGLCLDLTDGNTADGTQVQTWACTANDDNQVWNLEALPIIVPITVVQLHPNGDASKCLDVRAATFADGTPVQM